MSKRDTEETPIKSGAAAIEKWAAKNATPDWLFKATKIAKQWAGGAEVSEAEYLSAVDVCANGRI